jgi:hypothetical protein
MEEVMMMLVGWLIGTAIGVSIVLIVARVLISASDWPERIVREAFEEMED